MEDQLQGLAFGKAAGFFGRDHFALDGLGNHLVAVNAGAVVADFNHDLIALMVGIEANGPLGGFSRGEPLGRCLNAMVDGITD